jgi:hypothetical protein
VRETHSERNRFRSEDRDEKDTDTDRYNNMKMAKNGETI